VNEEVFPLFSLASVLNALRDSPVIRFVSALNGDRVGEKAWVGGYPARVTERSYSDEKRG
jgi:hypothetical protein